jgi:hypothetical protein
MSDTDTTPEFGIKKGDEDGFDPASIDEVEDELRERFGYTFVVGGNDGHIILLEGRRPLIEVLDDIDVIVHDSPESEPACHYDPTDEFWRYVVAVNDVTGRLAAHHTQCDELIEDYLPDIDSYKHIHSHTLPKYEATVLFELSAMTLRARVNHQNPLEDYNRIRRLYKTAYEEAGFDVPEYLTDFS